jgi:hypothetical protein
LGLNPSAQAGFNESPGTYPEAEPYEFGGVEHAASAEMPINAPAATKARNLLIYIVSSVDVLATIYHAEASACQHQAQLGAPE